MYSTRVGWWVLGVAAVCVVLWVAHRLGWIDLSDKSRKGAEGSSSGGGGMMLIGDEVFAPAKYEAQLELDRQARLPVPAPVPGDGDKGIFGEGPVRIRLDADGRPLP